MKGNALIKNASQVVTCSGFKAKQGEEMSDLHIITDGAVLIEDGIIKAIGKTDEILAKYSEEVLNRFDGSGIVENAPDIIDATNKCVLPGFVDSHTHLVFGGYRADEFSWRLRGDTYMEIMQRGGGISSTVNDTRAASRRNLIRAGKKRLDSMLSFGVTTVEGKSGYGLNHDTEIKQLEVMRTLDEEHPVDVVRTFMGAHAIPPEYEGKADDFVRYLINEVMPDVVDRDLAEFCDVFCEKNVFSISQSRELLTKARIMGMKLKLHADEMVPLGGAELAAELGAISADHLLQASDKGIRDMAQAGVVATLLPGTAFSLKAPYARARYMIDSNCAVALATDLNPGSCFSESIPLLFALATLYMKISTEEAITALTLNAAAAIDRADTIGSIDVGKTGDIIVLEFPSYHYLPYHTGVNSVEKVIKNGQLVFDKEDGLLSSEFFI